MPLQNYTRRSGQKPSPVFLLLHFCQIPTIFRTTLYLVFRDSRTLLTHEITILRCGLQCALYMYIWQMNGRAITIGTAGVLTFCITYVPLGNGQITTFFFQTMQLNQLKTRGSTINQLHWPFAPESF